MSSSNSKQTEEPPVYLGYIEDDDKINLEICGKREASSSSDDELPTAPWLINKVGGTPIFPHSEELVGELNSILDLLVCRQCKQPCMLLFQISSPIDDNPLDRIIQVYVCVTKNCSKHTWFALRCMLPQRSAVASNSDCNKFVTVEDPEFGPLVMCKDRAFFEPYYISVMEEPTGRENFAQNNIEALKLASKFNDPDLKPAPIEAKYKNLKNYQAPKPPSNLSDLDDFEKFQMENLYGNDKDLYRYYKRVNRFKGQVVRYEWEGQPLLNSSKIKINLLSCDSCGSRRKFEMQLMSALINYLKTDKEFDRDSHDFASIVVSSCSKNCSSKIFNVEDTFIMPDPDSRIFNKVKRRVIALKTQGDRSTSNEVEMEVDSVDVADDSTDQKTSNHVQSSSQSSGGKTNKSGKKKKRKN